MKWGEGGRGKKKEGGEGEELRTKREGRKEVGEEQTKEKREDETGAIS